MNQAVCLLPGGTSSCRQGGGGRSDLGTNFGRLGYFFLRKWIRAPMSRNWNNNNWYNRTWFIGVFHPIFNWWNPITVGPSLGHIMSHQCFAAWICPQQDWMGWEAICWDGPDLLGSRALVICWKTIVAIMTFPSPVSQSPTGPWDYKRPRPPVSHW